MSDRRMKGQKYYRVLLILPYALPIFLTAILWKGMLNVDFGIINQILPGNTNWLGEPMLARFSVLFVNLWIAYPYFLLVCTGALTAIPGDLKEAAFVDGASGFHAFRTVILPLLMISVAPLLIASFAFNFNNFTLIEYLTGGGPFPGPINDGGVDRPADQLDVPKGVQRHQPAVGPGGGHRAGHLRDRRDDLGDLVPCHQEA